MFGGFFADKSPGGRTGSTVVLGLLAALVVGSVLLLSARPSLAAETFVVNRTTNESDASLGDDRCDINPATTGDQCALRAALQQANEVDNSSTDPDEIHFNIPADRTKVKTIRPAPELPMITQPVIIDGFTQPASRKNTRATGAINAVLKVQLDGSESGNDADGLIIQGTSDVTIRGLVVNRRSQHGIRGPVLLQPARHRRGQDLCRRPAGTHQRERHGLDKRLRGEQDGPGRPVDYRDRNEGRRPQKHLGVQRRAAVGQARSLKKNAAAGNRLAGI